MAAMKKATCDLSRAEEGVAGDDLNGNGYSLLNGRSDKSSFASDDESDYNHSAESVNNNEQCQDYVNGGKLTRYKWNNNSNNSRAEDGIEFTQLSSAVESSGRSSRSSRSVSGDRYQGQQRMAQQEDDHTRESSSSSSSALHNSSGVAATGGTASPPSEDNYPTTVYSPPGSITRSHYPPFLFTQQTHPYFYPAESEKLRKMRAGKERKENRRKDKNVNTAYTTKDTEGSNYDVETILESLGENGALSVDKKSKKSKPPNEPGSKKKPADQSSQTQQRKRSNGKEAKERSSVDESDDLSDASREAETEKDDSDLEVGAKVPLDKFKSEAHASSKPTPADSNNSCRDSPDIKNVIDFPEKIVMVSQLESGGSDLKRQTSRSTENLSSFTEVTKKRDRKKKSPLATDDSHDYRSSQHAFRAGQSFGQSFESKRFHVNGALSNSNQQRSRAESSGVVSVGGQPHVSSASSTTSQDSSRSSSTPQLPSNVLAQSKFLASGVRPSQPPPFSRQAPPQPAPHKSSSQAPDLDLSSSDFPPLEAEEDAASAQAGPPAAWTLSRPAATAFFTASPPSGASCTSDYSAVISKTERKTEDEDDPSDTSSVKTLVPGEWSTPSATSLSSAESSTSMPSQQQMQQVPPDVTKDAGMAGGTRQFSLPDIAAQAPLGSVSSGECTPPCAGSEKTNHSDDAECFDREGASSSRHSTASFFVDVDNNVEIVTTEEEYNMRRQGGVLCAPVVILGKGETSIEDWTSSSGVEFGFGTNDELLKSSSTSSVPSTIVGDDPQFHQHAHGGHQPLDHLDDAIVKFGAPMAFQHQNPHGHYFDMAVVANWHQQHLAAFVNDAAAASQFHASEVDNDVASGKSTPKAVQMGEAATEDVASTDPTKTLTKQKRSDFLETVSAINLRWEEVSSALKSKAAGVVYYVPVSTPAKRAA